MYIGMRRILPGGRIRVGGVMYQDDRLRGYERQIVRVYVDNRGSKSIKVATGNDTMIPDIKEALVTLKTRQETEGGA